MPPSATYAKTSPAEVLTRVMARLIAEVTDATAVNTFLTTRPDDPPPAGAADVYFGISLDEGPINRPMLAGAGENIIRVETTIAVNLWTIYRGDRSEWDTEFLTNDTLGILPRCTGVIAAFTNHELLNAGGDRIVAENMMPLRLGVRSKLTGEWGQVMLPFECNFDWAIA